MYLIDTNIISEIRKGEKADKGVQLFFSNASKEDTPLYLSVITIGELRRGVELIRYRGDESQALLLEHWLNNILSEYNDNILHLTEIEAQLWGKLRVPHYENSLDKLIAATALSYQLILVTRNTRDFKNMGIELLNPFTNFV